MKVDAIMEVVEESFPDIPEGERHEFADQIKECVYRYGEARTMSIGAAVELIRMKREAGNG